MLEMERKIHILSSFVLSPENNHKVDQGYQLFLVGRGGEKVKKEILTLNHLKTEKEV